MKDFVITPELLTAFGYRIREIPKVSDRYGQKTKLILQRKIFGFWITLKKPGLDIITEFDASFSQRKNDHWDHVGRLFRVVMTDGECRTIDDVMEFLNYTPMKPYMKNTSRQEVRELWANNHVARNFLSAGHPYKPQHVSRVGMFFTGSKNQTFFEAKGPFWEGFFYKRWNMQKIA